MITEKLARSQIEAVLLSLQPTLQKQKAAQASVIRLESGEIMDCIERSVKSLKELFDTEARKMILEFAKDVAFGFEALFRAQLAFLQAPDAGFDVERAGSIYAGIQASFQEKYAAFFASEYNKPEEVFLSMKENLDEIRTESARLVEQLSKPVVPAQATQPETKQPEEAKPKAEEASSSRKADGSFFSSIKSVFSKFKPANDGFIKTDLGKDSSGMKWDPVKKKWCFDDNEEEEVEEVKKLPPKKTDIEKKKLEDPKKDEAPPEKTITDSLIKPRGRTAADRAKARRAGGDKPGPKVARLSANVFAGINSQAATFTFEQQRELIIFELRELVASSLNQMKPVCTEPEAQEEYALFEADLRTYRARLVEFIENVLQRAYSHTYTTLREARASAKAVQPSFSQACQTDEQIDTDKRELVVQVEALHEKLAGLELCHEEETRALAHQAACFRQLASRMTEATLREHQTTLQLAQIADEAPPEFSEDELQSLAQLLSVLGESAQSWGKTASRARCYRSCLELLLRANSRQSELILEHKKQLREQQAQLYELGQRQAVLIQEKQVLKAASRALLEESLHYQRECDRLHLGCLKAQKAQASLLKSHQANVDFCNRLLASFGQRSLADQQTYEQIFSELQNIFSLEKLKNLAATQRVENIIKHKVDVLKKDVIKLQNGIDSWQGQYELVNQERIDLVKQLVDSDSKYNETLNHVQAALSRELEVQKKLEATKEQRKRLEDEAARLRTAKSELQSRVDRLQDRLRAADEEKEILKSATSDRNRLLEGLAEAESKTVELNRENKELKDALKTETERLLTELQTAQDSIAEQTATVKLYEQLWAEAWGYIQSHADYPLEAQMDNLKEAIELLCSTLGAKASTLEAQLDQKQRECDQMSLQLAQGAEDSNSQVAHALEEAESRLQLAQKDFDRVLEQAHRRHAEEQLSLQKMVDDFETKQNEAEKLIADKVEELDKLQAAHQAMQESAQRTAMQISQLIQDKEALQLTLKQQENSLLDLQDANTLLTKDLKEQIAATSSGDAATSLTIASLQSQLEAKESVLEELRKRLREEEHRALSLQGELVQRQRATDSAQESEAAYKEELGELTRRLELAQQELRRLEEAKKRQETAAAPEPSTSELQQQVEEHEKRIALLQMDLLEAKKAGEEYRQDIEDLRSKLFSELQTSALAGSREASELLELFFAETK